MTGKPNQSLRPAPLCPIPAMGLLFKHLLIDCVGPLPPLKSGNTFLLTVMCQTTWYPAAFPLRKITTKAVVKALSQFITIFGIPGIIQSDRGTNFTSKMFGEILKQLRVRHQQSSAYRPQSQGALECFHQTLKTLLWAFITLKCESFLWVTRFWYCCLCLLHHFGQNSRGHTLSLSVFRSPNSSVTLIF